MDETAKIKAEVNSLRDELNQRSREIEALQKELRVNDSLNKERDILVKGLHEELALQRKLNEEQAMKIALIVEKNTQLEIRLNQEKKLSSQYKQEKENLEYQIKLLQHTVDRLDKALRDLEEENRKLRRENEKMRRESGKKYEQSYQSPPAKEYKYFEEEKPREPALDEAEMIQGTVSKINDKLIKLQQSNSKYLEELNQIKEEIESLEDQQEKTERINTQEYLSEPERVPTLSEDRENDTEEKGEENGTDLVEGDDI